MSFIENVEDNILFEILLNLDVLDIRNISNTSIQLYQKCQLERNSQILEKKRYLKYAGGRRMTINSEEDVTKVFASLGLSSEDSIFNIYYKGTLLTDVISWNNTIISKDEVVVDMYLRRENMGILDFYIKNSLIRINCNDCTFMISPYLNHRVPITQKNMIKNLVQYYCADDADIYINSDPRYTWMDHSDLYSFVRYSIHINKLINLPFDLHKFKFLDLDTVIIDCETNDGKYFILSYVNDYQRLTTYYHVKDNYIQLTDLLFDKDLT